MTTATASRKTAAKKKTAAAKTTARKARPVSKATASKTTASKPAASKKPAAKPASKAPARKAPAAKARRPAKPAASKAPATKAKTKAAKPAARKASVSKASVAKPAARASKPAAPKTAAKAKTAAAKPAPKPAALKPAAAKPAAKPAAPAAKPVASAAKPAAAPAKPVARPASPFSRPTAAKPGPIVAPKKRTGPADANFRVGDYIVYPAHGVGKITGVEKEYVAGFDIEVFVVAFEQDKMTLRVPTGRAKSGGMRPLASSKIVADALQTLKGKARVKRTMWSRRAQEYEAKINSGDLISIAEVVRDLHRGENQPEQSYSERQLYESALDRMVREVAAVENIDREAALAKLSKSLCRAA